MTLIIYWFFSLKIELNINKFDKLASNGLKIRAFSLAVVKDLTYLKIGAKFEESGFVGPGRFVKSPSQ